MWGVCSEAYEVFEGGVAGRLGHGLEVPALPRLAQLVQASADAIYLAAAPAGPVCRRLDERERRRAFLLDHGLVSLRKVGQHAWHARRV